MISDMIVGGTIGLITFAGAAAWIIHEAACQAGAPLGTVLHALIG